MRRKSCINFWSCANSTPCPRPRGRRGDADDDAVRFKYMLHDDTRYCTMVRKETAGRHERSTLRLSTSSSSSSIRMLKARSRLM